MLIRAGKGVGLSVSIFSYVSARDATDIMSGRGMPSFACNMAFRFCLTGT
jgi:hypothetical protein